jgi:hypothetical protein
MKKRYILLTTLFVVFALLFWWRSHRQMGQAVQQSDAIETNQAANSPPPVPKAEQSAAPVMSAVSEPTPASNSAAWVEKRRKEMDEALEKSQDRWRTPIEFYGQVVDESTNPVAGAEVHFVWTDLSPTGNSEKQATSDSNGRFSLRNVTGMNLIVRVSKQGYYAYQPFGAAFNYAGQDQNFAPDAASPVIFRLRKKGVAEPLIRFRKTFSVPKDGSPIQVDLVTGNLVTAGNAGMKVECWTQDAGKKPGERFDWKCRVSLAGGGIQPCTEQFPFLAPAADYASSDEVDMTVKPDQPWQLDVQRSYFVHTADGRYGRVVFRMIAHGDHFCMIESCFNPSGSRNLEFDQNNATSGGN